MKQNQFLNYPFKNSRNYKGFFFILGFNTKAGNFLVGIKKRNEIVKIGGFSKGLEENEKDILIKAIKENGKTIENDTILVDPGICVELEFKGINDHQLVNTGFLSFQFQLYWEECTWDGLILENTPVQEELTYTSLEKLIWKNPLIHKEGYLSYLAQISSFMLPFLKNKLLTTIRFPHGVPGESFFQKNCPDYAPSFIKSVEQDENHYIVCNDVSTLLWLGNQLAIEFHIPFQTYESELPNEIVFDLDPPDREAFPLAIKAAKEMRLIFDSFNIKGYPKVSGSKGIQIHLPIKQNTLTYDDTRIFTSFISNYLIEKFPNDFTIERFKKNRGKRLYIDYVQHARRKTIICPYSARGKEEATVATPLFWDEITDDLKIETFTIPFVLERLLTSTCPMNDYFEQENPTLLEVIAKIKETNK
ncbi:DNA ligase D [Bacillus sp. EAC]|uniref:DNA ligase D n=1 Tax=Bacillus sp. EAC TaxID=1978338 RepID=UPI000B439589|nr:DNA ligase D [Bacillus sp. EAC]